MKGIIDIVGALSLLCIIAASTTIFAIWIVELWEKLWDRACNFIHYLIYREEFKYWFKYERKKENS